MCPSCAIRGGSSSVKSPSSITVVLVVLPKSNFLLKFNFLNLEISWKFLMPLKETSCVQCIPKQLVWYLKGTKQSFFLSALWLRQYHKIKKCDDNKIGSRKDIRAKMRTLGHLLKVFNEKEPTTIFGFLMDNFDKLKEVM